MEGTRVVGEEHFIQVIGEGIMEEGRQFSESTEEEFTVGDIVIHKLTEKRHLVVSDAFEAPSGLLILEGSVVYNIRGDDMVIHTVLVDEITMYAE